ncbi:hypothetical protein ZWY2020_049395 [Hordeum vulgare]|nr:hypothetical protein ZWY2020_049395 [Hordeum vulgare]
MLIDGVPKGSSSDLPAALRSTDSNQLAEQDGLENSASISASPKEHEKLKETSDEIGGGNSSRRRTDDDSHFMNLVGYSEDSDEDDSVQVADVGDVGCKETTPDGISAVARKQNQEMDPAQSLLVKLLFIYAVSVTPDSVEHDDTVVPVALQEAAVATEPEAKKEVDEPTQNENGEPAAIKPEVVEHAGTEADPKEKKVEASAQEDIAEAVAAEPEPAGTQENAEASTQPSPMEIEGVVAEAGELPSTERGDNDVTIEPEESDASAAAAMKEPGC